MRILFTDQEAHLLKDLLNNYDLITDDERLITQVTLLRLKLNKAIKLSYHGYKHVGYLLASQREKERRAFDRGIKAMVKFTKFCPKCSMKLEDLGAFWECYGCGSTFDK